MPFFSFLSSEYFYFFTIALQLVTVIHAVRNGKTQPWLYVIVFLPIVGSLAYLFVEVFSDPSAFPLGLQLREAISRLSYRKPNLSHLEEEVELNNTTANRLALADAYAEHSKYEEAIELYRTDLKGIYASDVALHTKLIEAYFATKRYREAKDQLETLRALQGRLRSAELLLYARSLEELGDTEAALAAYEDVVKEHPGIEGDFRYYLLLQRFGHDDKAVRHLKQTERKYSAMLGKYQSEEKKWMKRLREVGNSE